MPIEILMPALSPTMTEGNLAKWLKREGDEVHSGDVLAEIETDKATMEVEAVDDGRVGRILVPEGTQGVKVNQPIALLLGEGEDVSSLAAASAQPQPAAAPASAPDPGPLPASGKSEGQPSAQSTPARMPGNGHDQRIFASPLARRMAQQAGLDLAAITGSGPQGRIVKSDIEAAILAARQPAAPVSATPTARPAAAPVPAANASWSDEAILQWDTVDIAVAVALDDGLITPIVKQADRKGLATIANETKDLTARARAGKLKLEEFQGGTFSISNLGMFGVREFAAVINPPHGGILAVGAGEQRAVVKNGALAVATVMSCTLSCDHRAVDGAVGAQFLAAFKKLVEDPLTMLL